MPHLDPRVIRSRAALHQALLSLTEAETAEVTVTALCETSGLNRGTFYLHYNDVNELATEVARRLVDETVAPWRELDTTDIEDFLARSENFVTGYLQHIDQQRGFYNWLFSPAGSWHVVKSILDDYAEAISHALSRTAPRTPESPTALILLPSFLAGALFGVVSQWATNPPDATAQEVSKWLWRELSVHPAP